MDWDTPHAATERWLQLLLFTGQASRRLKQQLAAVAADLGAAEQDLLALWLCRYPVGPKGSQGELAQWLGISAAQMSAVIERLRQTGWLSVERQGLDRRRHQLQVSAAGESILAAAEQKIAALHARLGRCLTENDEQTLSVLLALLAEPAHPPARGAAA